MKSARNGFLVLAAATDLFAILASSIAASVLHTFVRNVVGATIAHDLPLAGLAGVFFVATSLLRNDYALKYYLKSEGHLRRTFVPWCIAFSLMLVTVVSTIPPAPDEAVRIASLFLIGLMGVSLARLGVSVAARTSATQGRLTAKRIFVIGFEAELESFTKRFEDECLGMHIVAASVLRGSNSLAEDLALAKAYARILAPDDVFILVPWSERKIIDAAVDAFFSLPVAIYLGPDKTFGRFTSSRIDNIGPMVSLNLVDHPLSPPALLTKRVFDVVAASLTIVILAPLFVIVAVAIKLDSPGPIIFRQRRYGFNQQPFRIFKFRSMTTCEDDSKLVQVLSQDDTRLTRVGAFLRRHNIDELPQLINVILGQMSLVGPRPLALAHDQRFERIIAHYARRHNVMPGITGWAQINGCRGGINENKMRARLAHDLYYIDHWSMRFDIEILWMTLVSKQAYVGAI